MGMNFHILNGMEPRNPFPGSGAAVFQKKSRGITKVTLRKRKKSINKSKKSKKSKKVKKVPPAGPESKKVSALG